MELIGRIGDRTSDRLFLGNTCKLQAEKLWGLSVYVFPLYIGKRTPEETRRVYGRLYGRV